MAKSYPNRDFYVESHDYRLSFLQYPIKSFFKLIATLCVNTPIPIVSSTILKNQSGVRQELFDSHVVVVVKFVFHSGQVCSEFRSNRVLLISRFPSVIDEGMIFTYP